MTILSLCLLLALNLVAYLLPGLAVAHLLPKPDARGPSQTLLIALLTSGSIAYGCFFFYQSSPLAGRIFSFTVLGAALAVFAKSRMRAELLKTIGSIDVLAPIVLVVAFGTLFTGATFLYGGVDHPTAAASLRYLDPLPPDNILPGLLADRVVDGVSGEPFFADWLSSDRPPLQAGADAFVSPFVSKTARELNYQALATALQLLFIPALWSTLRCNRISVRDTTAVVVAIACSGTIALHSTYVWPKLLSAAYCLVSLAALAPTGRSLRSRAVTSGWAMGLAFAAHGGALFIATPLAIIACCQFVVTLLRKHTIRPLSFAASTIFGVLTCAAVFVPWTLYQHNVAPPGNRLLKWHLAGVVAIDPRSVTQALTDSYVHTPFSKILEYKRANFRELVNPQRFFADVLPIKGDDAAIDRVRQREFGHLGNMISLSVVGLLLGAVGLAWKRRHGQVSLTSNERLTMRSLLFAALATSLWCLLLYGPGATLPHQGSLLVPIMFLGAAALASASLHRHAPWFIVALSAFKVSRVWLFSGASASNAPRLPSAIAAITIGAIGVVVIIALVRRRTDGSPAEHIGDPGDPGGVGHPE